MIAAGMVLFVGGLLGLVGAAYVLAGGGWALGTGSVVAVFLGFLLAGSEPPS